VEEISINVNSTVAELKLDVMRSAIQDETRHDETIAVLYK
jgi:hypothetical protein